MSALESTFYVTGGTLHPDAPSYVERQADRDLYEGLLRAEFCYVLTSRQMGKSSLMVRTANKLRGQGVNVVVLDLTAIGQNLTPEQWYDGLIVRMGRQLRLEEELEDFWKEQQSLGPSQRLFAAVSDLILPTLKSRSEEKPTAGEDEASGPPDRSEAASRLVIFVDELDTVRSLPFSTDEFFAAIRECYNRRSEDPAFNRMTFCLLGVAMPSDLIRDTRMTPFNIGRRTELNDFTEAEAAPLAAGLEVGKWEGEKAPDTARALLKRILYWTHGHPYLTQRLCRAVAETNTDAADRRSGLLHPRSIDRLCEDLFLSNRARERDDNLLFVRERMLRSEAELASLLSLFQQVRERRNGMRDDETNPLVGILRLAGIVRVVEGYLRVRNRIYFRVFDRAWVQANMPDAEVRRQREAYRRGAIRAAAVASVIIAAFALLAWYAVQKSRQARAEARRAENANQQTQQANEALQQANQRAQLTNKKLSETLSQLELQKLRPAKGIPLRDPATKPGLIDLSAYYTHTLTNVSLRDGTLDKRADAFAGLPTGVQKLGGIEYDIRGIVGRRIGSARDSIVGTFPVGFNTPRLLFLQGANTPHVTSEGTPLGRYVVHYANQRVQEIPVVYGKHARDFLPMGLAQLAADEAPIVWVGMNKFSREMQTFVRLHEMTWVNPFPDITIERIDFEPAAAEASIFLVAITAGTDSSSPNASQPSAGSGGGLANETSLTRTLETIRQAIASHPNNAIFWQAQGILQEKLGQFEDALKTYTDAFDLAERQPEVFPGFRRRILATRSKLLMKLNRTAEAKADQLRAKGIPARDANTRPNLIDLTAYYNAGLEEDWEMEKGSHLANFPPGILTLDGIDFDVRGIIQLSGVVQARVIPDYPESGRGIPLDRVSSALHFLHATRLQAPDGTELGHYLVHYADGEQANIPVVYGKDVREWWFRIGERDIPPAAWKGTQQRWLKRRDLGARLYHTTWQNPRHDVKISSVDYVSKMTEAAPFLIAITAEP